MRRLDSGKARAFQPQTVAVISSPVELERATRLRNLPSLFELRLDAWRDSADALEAAVAWLARPIIVTARHPAEGGLNNLPLSQRRSLLLRFLTAARFVDVELRSVQALADPLAEARRLRVRCILSVHEFECTPSLQRIEDLAARAHAAEAHVFKLVTRVDSTSDLDRLLAGFELSRRLLPTSAMAVGVLGRRARVELWRRGSVLNYAHLGARQADGQMSLRALLELSRSR